MSKNASGQLLGYAMQFPRALCHLLEAVSDCTVCIEVHGDVATVQSSGEIIAEEDKSSIHSNPVTDKSVELWKTLSNWVDSVRAGEFDLNTTTFVLYRNRAGQNGLAEAFHACTTPEQAEQALVEAGPKFANLDASHPIWPYYKNVMIDHRETLVGVIARFQLETGDLTGYAAVEQELRLKLVPVNQIDTVVKHLNGWLVRLVMTRISQNKPAIVTFDEFAHECAVLFARARCLDLLDFATYSPPSSAEIDQHIKGRPTYLRQIEFVKAENDDLIEAVTDFLKAKTNRDKWIEEELIDEEVASQFEEDLRRFWKNKKKEVTIVHGALEKEARGMLLFSQCQNHQETIRNVKPPPSTIAGTYHALADKPCLGWHEDWEAEFKK